MKVICLSTNRSTILWIRTNSWSHFWWGTQFSAEMILLQHKYWESLILVIKWVWKSEKILKIQRVFHKFEGSSRWNLIKCKIRAPSVEIQYLQLFQLNQCLELVPSCKVWKTSIEAQLLLWTYKYIHMHTQDWPHHATHFDRSCVLIGCWHSTKEKRDHLFALNSSHCKANEARLLVTLCR